MVSGDSKKAKKKSVEMYLLDVLPNPPIPRDVDPHSCCWSSTVIVRIWEPNKQKSLNVLNQSCGYLEHDMQSCVHMGNV